MSAARGKHCRGFTLIELMIALTLLGLLAMALSGGFRFGLRAWERGQAHATADDEIRVAQSTLRRELQRSYPYFLGDANGHAHVDFRGTADSLVFLGPPPAALVDGGWARIAVQSELHNGKQDLVVSVQPELAASSPEREHLLDGAQSIAFAFYGKYGEENVPRWHERWEDGAVLPQLVRLDVAFPDGDPRHWLDFVVAPRVSVDVACAFDPLTRYCRGR